MLIGLIPAIYRRDCGYRLLNMMYTLEYERRMAIWCARRLAKTQHYHAGLQWAWSVRTGTVPPQFYRWTEHSFEEAREPVERGSTPGDCAELQAFGGGRIEMRRPLAELTRFPDYFGATPDDFWELD